VVRDATESFALRRAVNHPVRRLRQRGDGSKVAAAFAVEVG
jgi:hypothetical protein